MKNLIPCIFILILFLSSCRIPDQPENTLHLNEDLSLDFNEKLEHHQLSISISFDSLLSDSRCPIGAMCVWAGNAELLFTLRENNCTHKLNLNTNPHSQQDTTTNAYRVKLIDVQPYPHVDSTFSENDYTALIRINRQEPQ
ncbi:MAG: hypothetical protein U5R06_13725 [candidate division KSB1 bacterium]|nr:hypothetical protein [candidate division KSB1 bacterium]